MEKEKDYAHLKTLIIGDSRTAGYGFCLSKYLNVLGCISHPGAIHQTVMEFVENNMVRFNPNLLIVISLFEDIIEKVDENSSFRAKESFQPIGALENIKYYSNRWSSRYPNLRIIWTLPDVPDLVEFSHIKEGYKYDASDRVKNKQSERSFGSGNKKMRTEEKTIFKKLQEFRKNFSSIVTSPKSFLINLRSFIIDEDVEERLLSFITSHSHKVDFYIDGVNPKHEMSNNLLQLPISELSLSELFANEILKILKKNISPIPHVEIECDKSPKIFDDLR